MSTSAVRVQAHAVAVSITEDALKVTLADGREVSAPLAWFPRLLNATDHERSSWRLIGKGIGIHWPEIDEDVSVENLLTV